MTGTQAAGKSTVGAALAGRFGRGMFVDGDEIAAMVVSGRVDYEPDAAPAATEQHTKRVGLWLDTTEQTVDQTVDTILSRLDEARLDA